MALYGRTSLEEARARSGNAIVLFTNSSAYYARETHARALHWAKFSEKVHKPSLWINVINFELNVFNVSILVPWSPLDPKSVVMH